MCFRDIMMIRFCSRSKCVLTIEGSTPIPWTAPMGPFLIFTTSGLHTLGDSDDSSCRLPVSKGKDRNTAQSRQDIWNHRIRDGTQFSG